MSNNIPTNSTTISFREKVAYGLGDTSANIFMGLTMMFLTVYYTDVFELNPAVMGTLFLVTRIIDAISDPLIGAVADRNKTKLGHYRPWLLWGAIPYGISCVAVFFTPDLSETGKIIYAYVTYIALILTFSVVVVPYVSLLGVLTSDANERIKINAVRFPLAKTAYLLCSVAIPAVLASFDNQVVGYRVVMTAIGILCTILVLVCFFGTKERVDFQYSENISFAKQFKFLMKNEQALMIFAAQISVMIMNTLKYGSAAYFVKYVLQQPTSYLPWFLGAASIAGIIAPFIGSYLLDKKMVNRVQLLIVAQAAAAVLSISMFFVSPELIMFQTVLFVISILAHEIPTIVGWATISDCADYGEYRDGVRINALIGGGMLFSTKLGMAIGGALIGYVLAYYDYKPDMAITADSDFTFGMMLLMAIIPAICHAVASFIFSRYKLTDDYLLKMNKSTK
ncbi:MFS transporter [Vibrio artabrorum]|uniref:MFS transporter n=1 Tax=Vibrio artabrorum TaxID=446374 RepID=UPI00355371E1